MSKKYKYECRPCPPRVRSRCIQEAQLSPGVKRIIERAFEYRSDTQDTYDLLHRNCLLELRDQMVIGRQEAEQQGGLRSRIRQHEEQQEEAPPAEETKDTSPPPVVRPPSRIEPGWQPNWDAELQSSREETTEPPLPTRLTRSRDTTARSRAAEEEPETPTWLGRPAPEKTQTQSMLERISRLATERRTSEMAKVEPTELPSRVVTPPTTPEAVATPSVRYPTATRPTAMPMLPRGPRMLVAETTGHRILLPEEGELTLGRFDPLTKVTPDVDLTFEDRIDRGVSRRHCQISSWRGQYEISDLGSSNGAWINGTRLDVQEKHLLQIGDEVSLGTCRMFFDRAPSIWQSPPPSGRYFFYVTFSGRYFPLPEQNTILLGRLDPSLGYQPDIDLSQEGDVASVVSRRHAKVTRQGDNFVVEDLGSAFKTRIDGKVIPVGLQVDIKPGQHLCLGGCILAFDLVER
jgi:pSer/pThr/pTyr-binding forkhead associated (FHA) protein